MLREEYALRVSYPSSSTSRSNSGRASPGIPTDNLSYDVESLSSDDSISATRRTYALPVQYHHNTNCYSTTSAYRSPIQSRSNSPSPYSSQYFTSEDDQPSHPLLRTSSEYLTPPISSPPRRKRATDEYGRRVVRRRHAQISLTKRVIAAIIRHPLFPSSPSSIVRYPTDIGMFSLTLTFSV